MPDKKVTVDISGIESIQRDLTVAKRLSLGRLAERGYQHLRDEVPYETGNLKQGVAPPDIDNAAGRATLTVSARSGNQGARPATVHYPSGKTKQVMLRPTLPFNYAEVVARGNKAGPIMLRPMLIPVDAPPRDESYVQAGGLFFVVRMSRKRQTANPFDERAGEKLEAEAPNIVGKVFEELFS